MDHRRPRIRSIADVDLSPLGTVHRVSVPSKYVDQTQNSAEAWEPGKPARLWVNHRGERAVLRV